MKHSFPSPTTPRHGRNGCLALVAAGMLALTVLGSTGTAHATATPNVTVQIKNAAGGCLKDQGLGNPYTVSNCAISSNFTRTGYNLGGIEAYMYTDGTGNAVTASGMWYVAGHPAGSSTQQFFDPSPQFSTYYDILTPPSTWEMVKIQTSLSGYSAARLATSGGENQWSI